MLKFELKQAGLVKDRGGRISLLRKLVWEFQYETFCASKIEIDAMRTQFTIRDVVKDPERGIADAD